MSIPELEIDIGSGALSGRFTTVEGILSATKDQLKEQFTFFFGDSASDPTTGDKFDAICNAIEDIIALKRPATLILDDPAGNSYIQSLNDEGTDPRLSKEFYTRSFEQNEELGLNDMRVENYENLDTIKEEDGAEA
jgi:zinc finger protein